MAYSFPVRMEVGGMKTVSYTEARAGFASVLDTAVNDLEEVVVTRAGRPPAVVLALAEYLALTETLHLLRVPANAARLLTSVAELRAGSGVRHELIED
jgi:antitoxin YefM